ncbi:high mobility group box domain-containing protein [Radiomyces spectabilis]|uniref:high mobility group box domain-containing protein n=1 Tax=Radiomyces spectabilis TaxID=64574 RepID=UPI00221E7C79|nr:high mobility group box domain-containing protein [Radiomyces spectabilis]KAI8376040.1 high mobility group box domain-containing protein [Radiomyces spectabilis]
MTQPSASQKNPDLPPDSSQHNIADEQDIIQFFQSHHLSQYTDRFLEEGFDQIRSLYEVTESDLIYMGLIQRAIANAKGVPPMAPLIIDYGFGVVNDQPYGNPIVYAKFNSQVEQTPPPAVHTTSSGLSSNEDDGSAGESTPSRTWKRKYQRHPKPDQHAPVKPSSAYVMFSNQVRAELKDQNMSFTELAKIVGERWKHLSPTAKERYERNAMLKKEEYIIARAKYEQTQEYQAYQDYLDSFRAKHEGSGRSGKTRTSAL